ncbi:hypothetical protein [Elongatibacter sediminis]|uniref:Uncharacterized protein n=1 Tax=Elongatibacter sediminis TaxID=3119006 RepID=A0AAW9R853_9GAMM
MWGENHSRIAEASHAYSRAFSLSVPTSMKKAQFKKREFTIEEKIPARHRAMMGLLVNIGYAKDKYQGMWAKLLKESGINDIDLKRLLDLSIPKEYSKRGFVRNRLQNRDWSKYF